MKKKCQRGFVLAEAFIVSTFVLGVLVFMFLQIKTIINGYDKSFTYNTIPGIYHAREVKKFLESKYYDVDLVSKANENGFAILNNTDEKYTDFFKAANVKTVVLTKGDLTSLKMQNSLSPKFQNYIKTLTDSDEYKLIFEFNDDSFVTIKGW